MKHIAENEKNRVESGVLYLVATPIGNLADLSPRAIKVLSEVNFIAAEDTRNSGRLLHCFGITKPMMSYFEHNKKSHGDEILNRLVNGESCALITDAGTPAISDPGEDIVRLCAKSGIRVVSIPGCCAAVTALSLSGLMTRRFVFEGFLPPQKGERRHRLQALAAEPRTLILYEAPHRLCDTLQELYEAFGEREIALCRELTKLNEETLRLPLTEAIAHYKKETPRGEYVLVVEGRYERFGEDLDCGTRDTSLLALTPTEHVSHYEATGLSRMDAIKAAARDRGMSKSELYRVLNTDKD